MRDLVAPIMDRIGLEWRSEDEVLAGIRLPNMRLFWAERLGLVERRAPGDQWEIKRADPDRAEGR